MTAGNKARSHSAAGWRQAPLFVVKLTCTERVVSTIARLSISEDPRNMLSYCDTQTQKREVFTDLDLQNSFRGLLNSFIQNILM